MRIYRRPNSQYYWYSITLGGVRKRVSTKRTNRGEAQAVAVAAYKIAQDAAMFGVLPNMTLGEALDRWTAETTHLRDHRGIEIRCRKLVAGPGFAHCWGLDPDMLLSTLGNGHVASLRAARLKGGVAPETINKEVAALSRVYNLAAREWEVAVRPGVRFPKYKVTGKLRYLSISEEARLLAELDTSRPLHFTTPVLERQRQDIYDLTVFLLDTGCRWSEASTITWDCIDTDGYADLNIYRTKVSKAGVLGITGRLRAVLERRRGVRNNSPYIFCGYGARSNGHRGHSTNAIMKAVARAGLNEPHLVSRWGKATVHTFRDTFASRLAEAGFPLQKIAGLLGHTSMQMASKYAKFSQTAAAHDAASLLDRQRS